MINDLESEELKVKAVVVEENQEKMRSQGS